MTRDELAALAALIPLATPLEDTGHGQACLCAECIAVWKHAGALAHHRGRIVAALPVLLAHVEGLEKAARALVEALDRCRPLDRDITCYARATKLCFDACDDPVWTCDAHAFTGGMVEDTEPRELRTEAPARALLAKLGEP